MYVLRRGGDVAILVIWVDDMVLGCNSETLSKEIKEKLAKDLQITDLGPLSYFLGMHVQQHNEGLTLSQHKYAKEILVQDERLQACGHPDGCRLPSAQAQRR